MTVGELCFVEFAEVSPESQFAQVDRGAGWLRAIVCRDPHVRGMSRPRDFSSDWYRNFHFVASAKDLSARRSAARWCTKHPKVHREAQKIGIRHFQLLGSTAIACCRSRNGVIVIGLVGGGTERRRGAMT